MTAYYGTLSQGNTYFENKLESSYWTNNNIIRKERALREAKVIIDRLPFVGTANSVDDAFPRDDEADVPTNVRYAQYEIAYALLSGLTAEGVTTAGMSRLESVAGATVTKVGTLPHFANGVPSATAWNYLLPYMDTPGIIRATTLNEEQ